MRRVKKYVALVFFLIFDYILVCTSTFGMEEGFEIDCILKCLIELLFIFSGNFFTFGSTHFEKRQHRYNFFYENASLIGHLKQKLPI